MKVWFSSATGKSKPVTIASGSACGCGLYRLSLIPVRFFPQGRWRYGTGQLLASRDPPSPWPYRSFAHRSEWQFTFSNAFTNAISWSPQSRDHFQQRPLTIGDFDHLIHLSEMERANQFRTWRLHDAIYSNYRMSPLIRQFRFLLNVKFHWGPFTFGRRVLEHLTKYSSPPTLFCKLGTMIKELAIVLCGTAEMQNKPILHQILINYLPMFNLDDPLIGYRYPIGGNRGRVGWRATFKACDWLESYDLASLLGELFLLADSQPTRHFCSPFPRIGYGLYFLKCCAEN